MAAAYDPPVAWSRQYVKLCDVADFDDVDLLNTITSILPERDARVHVERKVWEFAMLALYLQEAGRLHDGTRALAVGAGDERILFWLANRMGAVVATDIYGTGEFAAREAHASMLTDPAAHAPYPYREDHLQVQWMDGRRLAFPDASFDVVFSLSSIEHVGGPRDIAAAAAEIGRVLKPGGHAMIVTDCVVDRAWRDAAVVDVAIRLATVNRRRRGATLRRRSNLDQMFTPRELRTRIVGPSGLRLIQPLDLTLSERTRQTWTRTHPDGRLVPVTGGRYPLVLLRFRHSAFTSVALALEKPAAPTG